MNEIVEFKENVQFVNASLPINIHINNGFGNNSCILQNHWHNSFEIIYFLRGSAVFNIGATEFMVEAGDILFVNSKVFHTGYSVSNTETSFCALVFDASILSGQPSDSAHTRYINPLIDNKVILTSKIAKDCTEYPFIENTLKSLISELNSKSTGYEIIVKAQLLTFITHLLRMSPGSTGSKEFDNMFNRYSKGLNNLISFLDSHYSEKITVEIASKIMHLSPFHFCRVFKKITGNTFNDFLNFYRVNKAEDILRTTDLSITEVAALSGFYDISYFDRVFKTYKKYTPKNVRKEKLT